MKGPAVCLLILAALGAMAWTLWPRKARPANPDLPFAASTVATAEASMPATATPAPAVSHTDPDLERLRAELPLLDPGPRLAGSGRLSVHVTFARGGSAAGVPVAIAPRGSRWGPDRSVVADPGGVAHFTARAGDYTVRAALGGIATTTVLPDRTANCELVIPPGFAVDGMVVSGGGAAVAGAQIWLSDSDEPSLGDVVGRSGSDGSFHLVDVNGGRWLGATAEHMQPAQLQRVEAAVDEHVPIRIVLLADGGRVAGDVRDAAGLPVADALVLIGDEVPARIKERHAAPATLLRTGPDGHFESGTLTPGRLPVAVRSEASGVLRGEVEVRTGTTTTVDLRLGPGAALQGNVHDGNDRGVAGLVCTDPRRWFSCKYTHAAANGDYRLGDLLPGSTWCLAGSKQADVTSDRFELRAGETVAWSPRLLDVSGRSLTGHVFDRAGNPVAGMLVTAFDLGSAKTDARGGFSIPVGGEDGVRVLLQVRNPADGLEAIPLVSADGIVGSDNTITLPDLQRDRGVLRGRVVDDSGRPLLASVLVQHRARNAIGRYATAADGTFAVDVPVGNLMIAVDATDHARLALEPQQLDTGRDLDLGTLRLTAGKVVTGSLQLADGSAPNEAKVLVFGGGQDRGLAEYSGGQFRTLPLADGPYSLLAWSTRGAPVRREFTVTDGLTDPIALTLPAGWPCTVAVELADGDSSRDVTFAVRDVSGVLLCAASAHCKDARAEVAFWLEPGEYRIEAIATGGKADSRLIVAGDAAPEPLVLHLQR